MGRQIQKPGAQPIGAPIRHPDTDDHIHSHRRPDDLHLDQLETTPGRSRTTKRNNPPPRFSPIHPEPSNDARSSPPEKEQGRPTNLTL